jgi:endoglucanase
MGRHAHGGSVSHTEGMSVAHDPVPWHRARGLRCASVVAAALMALTSALLSGCSSTAATPTTTTTPEAKNLAVAFLDRYVATTGRVIRWDQGGDSVSEAQGYGLLLAVAAHDASRFAAIWRWDRDNLQEPSGLFAYHWSNGAVVGTGNATDADLDTAWALVLGATSFNQPAYKKAGVAVASAVLANETVVSGGRIELVAGPWARNAPLSVDPSYFSPEAMVALAAATGDPRWSQLAVNSQRLVYDLQGGDTTRSLPPDWALLSASGSVIPSSPPSGGGPPSYGLDAQRLPIWYAADCTGSGRALSADSWPTISGLAGSGSYQAYSLTGAVQEPYLNNLGLVAAAASADADRQFSSGRALLAHAQSGSHGNNYYGDAWVALGTVLLTTTDLSPCPPAPGA